ncbi:MAG: hypothetical protein M3680_10990, partial [Myxococcota bacterium]|nr:hypothetical protein [Myxococcota bacterium]
LIVAPPVAPPNAAAEPAPLATVTLGFTSTPPGARVFRKGETVPLGVTPFTAELARSERSTPVRFELAGHEPIEIDASLAESEHLAVTLVATPAVVSQRTRPRKPVRAADPPKQPRTLQREGVMDPFATKN